MRERAKIRKFFLCAKKFIHEDEELAATIPSICIMYMEGPANSTGGEKECQHLIS